MQIKIGHLGAGAWGTALASLLANSGHSVIVWDRNPNNIKRLKDTKKHPKLKNFKIPDNVFYTDNILDAIKDVDMIVESVTSLGIRSVFSHIKSLVKINCPIVITSKGLEQETLLLFPEILKEIFGEENAKYIGCLSGPSLANEVIKNLPASVVASSYNLDTMNLIAKVFNTSNFRVYPNDDILGVAFGGAIKNIIAIACGISDGLGFGDNAKAALMTRGLHEMTKLISTKGGRPQTLNGLSGMGDLCVTCLSKYSRNNQFGRLIAKGYSLKDAKGEIGMIVEGVYTCISALQLARKHNIPTPITEAVKAVLYDNLEAKNVVKLLMQREIKREFK